MDDGIRLDFRHEVQNARAVADVEIVMRVASNVRPKTVQRPACIALGSEENSSFIVVDTKDPKPVAGQMQAYFGPNQPTGACNERFLFQKASLAYGGLRWVRSKRQVSGYSTLSVQSPFDVRTNDIGLHAGSALR